MAKDVKKNLLSQLNFKNMFSSEESKFEVFNSLQITSIFLSILLVIAFQIGVVIEYNKIFFEAIGYKAIKGMSDAYYDFILSTSLDMAPYIFGCALGLFALGFYISFLLVRPFKKIADYCEASMNDKRLEFDPELFSDYKLLTRFCDLFFSYISEARKKGHYPEVVIPRYFSRIRKPVLDKIFVFHFLLLMLIAYGVSSVILLLVSGEIYDQLVLFTKDYVGIKDLYVANFLTKQREMFELTLVSLVVLSALFYVFLSIYLYSKVSGAAFGIFSTMRAFMKGNRNARIHLIGFKYLRDHTRRMNKFLDAVAKDPSLVDLPPQKAQMVEGTQDKVSHPSNKKVS
jgi:hypothetical protein